jgi:Flp pilus assembly protein TadB
MWVFLGFTAGMCLLVVLWATGLAVDAAGVFALAILGIGVLVQMLDSRRTRASETEAP